MNSNLIIFLQSNIIIVLILSIIILTIILTARNNSLPPVPPPSPPSPIQECPCGTAGTGLIMLGTGTFILPGESQSVTIDYFFCNEKPISDEFSIISNTKDTSGGVAGITITNYNPDTKKLTYIQSTPIIQPLQGNCQFLLHELP